MSKQANSDEWLTIPEALTYLKVSKTTLYDCMKDGRLPFYYVRGTRQRRIRAEDLEDLMLRGGSQEFDS